MLSDNDMRYLRRALQLAGRAVGVSLPNPMVGAVIVADDGRIIGEGFTDVCGKGHAEVNAVRSVAPADQPLLSGSTVYVTLEPCAHYGKTPPCAALLIDKGVGRVVVGSTDPFAKVAGRGITMLRAAGIQVDLAPNDFADCCRRLNRKFFTAHTLKRPFITLKWAMSADGYTDAVRPDDASPALRLSSAVSTVDVHRLRACHDAILVGSGTMLADRPRLDVRRWTGRAPRPIVIDARHRLKPSDITTTEPATILDYPASLEQYLSDLYSQGITSVLVEGGPTTLRSFIEAGLWDEARIETAPIVLGSSGMAKAPEINGTDVKNL